VADLIAILLASLAGFFGSGASPDQLAESMAAAVLETQPVPIAEAEVSCGRQARDGTISEVVFALGGLTLDPLEIEQAEITVQDVRQLADGNITFSAIEWQAQIDDGALTKALRIHVEKMADAEVIASEGVISLKGTYPVWPIRLSYKVDGNLVVEHQTELIFHISRSGVSVVRLPAALNHLIESEINPVYDLAQFAARSKKDLDRAKAKLDYEFMLQVEEITAGDGFLLVTGDA
jgi:hypothetical protein